MTIDDVNETLDALSRTTWNRFAPGSGKEEEDKKKAPKVLEKQAKILKECIAKMTPMEMKWFIRIILRDLKVGVSERTVFGALHPDAMHLFNTCSDIKKVCWTLWDPDYRLLDKQKDVSLNSVFKPMLSWRAKRDLSSIITHMHSHRPPQLSQPRNKGDERNPFWCSEEEFIIEEKLDGERMQLHKMGGEYRYWSRKGTDYTNAYGANPGEGSLTPYIHETFAEGVEEVILDGEMLVWDPRLKKCVPFGTLKTFSKESSFGPFDPRPCFKVFDILYIKTPTSGPKTFLTTPLFERKGLLQQVFLPLPGIIEFVQVGKGVGSKDLSRSLKRIVEERGEGLVVKHPWSNYHLGGRENVWIKLKPDYMDELAETISGLVVGAYWGEGNRGGFHSSFLIGLRDDSKPYVDGQPHYQSFCKVGSGFSHADYDWLGRNVKDKWRNFDRKKLPSWFSTVNEFPDQLIKPSDSFIVEIKAAEIVPGKDYACGMTLRFPRAKYIKKKDEEIRDKLEESFSLQTVKDLGKRPKRMSGKEDLSGKKRAKFSKTSSKPKYISKPITDYENKSEIFKGLKFYVHNLKHLDKTREFIDKNAMQKLILEHGGDFGQRIPEPSPNRVVIASEWKGVHNKAGAKDADVLLESWVLESIQQGRLLPKVKRFYVRATPSTEASAEYNAMEDDGSPAAADLGSDEEEEEDDEPSPPEPELIDSKPDHAAIEAAFSALHIKPQEEVENEVTKARNEKEDASDYAASSDDDDDDDEPETEEEDFEEGFTGAGAGLGAGEGDVQFYGEDTFDQLVAYFDLSELAQANGLEMPKGNVEEGDKNLLEARAAFTSNGGIATDNLLDPKLTHIIVNTDLDNEDRRKMMIRLTSEPRFRKMVTYLWITESVEGAESGGVGPIDEADYKG
ncbi:ATP dependent DNA ligase domain-domain-containing protein [Leucosporidium creatinivorum]|uniref:DNA ligase n=1 Tax=Leucosporidium creatinivorum TaxID=106004 RepID=A0A1Y2G4E4_9BASI|nr:ATP dependent DNA ligase domain-domain-containing protein [Leucosporidium creatinivorum]